MATKSRAGGKLAGNTVRLAPVYRGQVDRMFTKESVMARLQEAEPGGCEVVDVRRDEGRIYFTLVRHDTGAILETVASEWVVVVLPTPAQDSTPAGQLLAVDQERARAVAYLERLSDEEGTKLRGGVLNPAVALALSDAAGAIRGGKHIP